MNPDLHFEMHHEIAVIRLSRPAKRNALNDALVLALADVFSHLPDTARAAVLHGEGEHFCAGLDLSELQTRDAAQGMRHSRMWHHAFERIQYGSVPVVAALHGAVVGGGLELAMAAHVRVADETVLCGLPEGQRGIFAAGQRDALDVLVADDGLADRPAAGEHLDQPRRNVRGQNLANTQR